MVFMTSYISQLSGMADAALSSVGITNPLAKIAIPGAVIIGGSLGSRALAGVGCLGAKGASAATNALGMTTLGKGLNSIGDALGNFATRSIKPELKLAAVATAITAGFVLTETPEPSTFEKLTNYVGLTSPTPSYFQSLVNKAFESAPSLPKELGYNI
jgi:hypothetical protein